LHGDGKAHFFPEYAALSSQCGIIPVRTDLTLSS
jgi:hypothetical protein